MNQVNEPTSAHDEPQVVTPLIRVDSKQLFDGQRELIIQHLGEEYRLRITRHDKLILTK
ncbi:MAG: hemin uptake protein HemP [Aquabacterium sp.]|uniref:hemin uptake protein HemP n=1 Tax=Aquabacterium sp. TaxID=1872578 RepID=UPI00122B3866|nr:hemin uptake protein HemP [Aquabacterium sp.]TAK98453.1 MAG: hemin uptake protein HemP [Aquabacterium sp.]